MLEHEEKLEAQEIAIPEVATYDAIINAQRMSIQDVKEHLTGPVIAILLHAIILPFVVNMVISEPAPEAPEVQMETVEHVPEVPPDPKPIEPPPDVLTDAPVTDIQADKPEIEIDDVEVDDPAPVTNLIDDPPIPVMMKPNNSKFILRGVGNPFGVKVKSPGKGPGPGKGIGSTLEGTFVDCKQDADGKAIDMPQEKFLKVLKDFVASDWSESQLKGFYHSPTQLYSACFYIPNCSAEDAPKAFQCADKVKASRWIAVYRGRIVAPKSGTFRFIGAGDDNITVRFNKKIVLDYGWFQSSTGQLVSSAGWRDALKGQGNDKGKLEMLKKTGNFTEAMKFYTYKSINDWNKNLGGIGSGQTFTVEAGEVYPIEILITEIPGGRFGAALMIEDTEADMLSYAQDEQTKSPIFSLFRTANVLPEPAFQTRAAVPFAAGGLIWRSVPASYRGGASVASKPEEENIISLN